MNIFMGNDIYNSTLAGLLEHTIRLAICSIAQPLNLTMQAFTKYLLYGSTQAGYTAGGTSPFKASLSTK